MDALDFINAQPKGKLQPIYVLHGDEALLKRESLLALRRYGEAASSFERALEVEPGHATARFNLGLARLAVKDRAAALEQYALLRDSNARLARQLYELIYGERMLHAGRR